VTAEVALVLVSIVAVVLGFRLWSLRSRSSQGQRIRLARSIPAPEAQDPIASLLLDVLSLRDSSAQWAAILTKLNPEDQPKLRTVLLELRWLYRDYPDAALRLIERVCMATRKAGSPSSRLELLEMSKSLAERSNLPTHSHPVSSRKHGAA